MILLNSALLAFLGVLGLPLLLHLLHLRRRRPQNLPTLRFLKEIEQNRLKRLNLTRLLLLLVRMALLAALVLAFARPISRVSSVEGQDPDLLIFLLDDTASMREADAEGQSRWDLARNLAAEISSRHASSQQVILPLSRPEDLRGPMSAEAVSRQLSGLGASWSGSRVDDVWPILEKMLVAHKGRRIALHLISDLELKPFALTLDAESYPGLEPELHQVGLPRDTWALLSCEAEGLRNPHLKITLHGSDSASREHQLNVLANGERVIQRWLNSTELAGSSFRLELPRDSKAQWIMGESYLEAIPDWRGRLFWACRSGQAIRAFLAVDQQELGAVLRAASRAALDEESVLRLDQAEGLQPGDIILAGLGRSWSNEERSRLMLARREGRGLFLFLEPKAEAQIASRQLEALGIGRALGLRQAGQGLLQLEDLDLDHPVLGGILEKQARLRMPGAGSLLDTDLPASRTLARSSNIALIAAHEDEQGRALILCMNPLDGDPALSMQGFFAPFVHGGISWLASQESSGSSVDCGRPVRMTLPARTERTGDWELVKGERSWRLEEGQGLKLPALAEPGIYRLQLNGKQEDVISANVPLDERTEFHHPRKEWVTADARWQQVDESGAESSALKDLSPWLLALALLLLLLESWLSTGRRSHESEF